MLPVAALGLALAGVLLTLQFVRLARNDLGRDATAPFIVGTSWQLDEWLTGQGIPVSLTPGQGYDGQWYLGLAYDPLLRNRVASTFDGPRYRARRPLTSQLGWLLAAGQAPAIPVALLAVGLLATGLGCAATGRLLAGHGLSRWWGLAFAAIPGVAVGVIFGTAEPAALGLAAVGLSLAVEGRLLACGVAFAAAGLAKETYLGFAAAVSGYLLVAAGGTLGGRVRRAAAVLLPGCFALAGWWTYVAWRLPQDPTDSSGIRAFTMPFAGWVAALRVIASGRYVPDAPVGPFGAVALVGSFGLLVVAVLLAARSRTMLGWAGLLFGVYGLSVSAPLLQTRFLSAMRTLAPCLLATGLLVLVTLPRLRHPDLPRTARIDGSWSHRPPPAESPAESPQAPPEAPTRPPAGHPRTDARSAG
jgi:hypothetical protein